MEVFPLCEDENKMCIYLELVGDTVIKKRGRRACCNGQCFMLNSKTSVKFSAPAHNFISQDHQKKQTAILARVVGICTSDKGQNATLQAFLRVWSDQNNRIFKLNHEEKLQELRMDAKIAIKSRRE
jgi:hypothetical protein